MQLRVCWLHLPHWACHGLYQSELLILASGGKVSGMDCILLVVVVIYSFSVSVRTYTTDTHKPVQRLHLHFLISGCFCFWKSIGAPHVAHAALWPFTVWNSLFGSWPVGLTIICKLRPWNWIDDAMTNDYNYNYDSDPFPYLLFYLVILIPTLTTRYKIYYNIYSRCFSWFSLVAPAIAKFSFALVGYDGRRRAKNMHSACGIYFGIRNTGIPRFDQIRSGQVKSGNSICEYWILNTDVR